VLATQGDALGQVLFPAGLAVDTGGNLYVADGGPISSAGYRGRIQKRDAEGNWFVIATAGEALGQVCDAGSLAVDAAGNLYVAVESGNGIQKRDAQGNWLVIATYGKDLGQVEELSALAVDTAGNLYVADTGNHRVQKYTALPGP
jgi:DNA-binding beta-propeller fold protein YncE